MFKAAVKETIPYHTAFVVNPTAGGGKAQRIWLKLEKHLNQTGQLYRSYLTRQTGDGTVLAARAFNEGGQTGGCRRGRWDFKGSIERYKPFIIVGILLEE